MNMSLEVKQKMTMKLLMLQIKQSFVKKKNLAMLGLTFFPTNMPVKAVDVNAFIPSVVEAKDLSHKGHIHHKKTKKCIPIRQLLGHPGK